MTQIAPTEVEKEDGEPLEDEPSKPVAEPPLPKEEKVKSTEPTVKAIDETDRLKSENLTLRAIKNANERSLLAMQIREKESEWNELQRKLSAQRDYLAKKYNIDFRRYQIQDESGEIIPLGGQLLPKG